MLPFNLLRHNKALICSAMSMSLDQTFQTISSRNNPNGFIRIIPTFTRSISRSFSSTPMHSQEKERDNFQSKPSQYLSNRTSAFQDSRSFSGFWGVIGTLFAATYLLKQYCDSQAFAYGDESHKHLPIDYSSHRSRTVEASELEAPIKKQEYRGWLGYGSTDTPIKPTYQSMHPDDLIRRFPNPPLESFPSSWTLTRDEDCLDGSDTWYKINDRNPFRVQRSEHGQLVWRTRDKVCDKDLKEVAALYEKLSPPRSLLINTGVHGDAAGKVFPERDSGNFAVGDTDTFATARRTMEGSPEVYVPIAPHLVSRHAHPLKPDQYKKLDFIDAWCWSMYSKDFSPLETGEEAPIECQTLNTLDMLNSFRVFGYTNKEVLGNSYVEPPGLKNTIGMMLGRFSFSYIKGNGGFGKSRIAIEIQNAVKASILNGNSDYFDVVFISLKFESDKEAFLDHVKSIVPVAKDDDEADILRKYFNLLNNLAQKKEKKVLIIIDNIDTENDITWFKNIANNTRPAPNGNSLFHLLATGRQNPSKLLGKMDLTQLEAVIEIENCYKEKNNVWQLFESNFLEKIPEQTKQCAQTYLNGQKTQLLELLEEYGNHPAFIVVLGQILGSSYKYGAKENISNSKELFKLAVESKLRLKDYPPLNSVAQGLVDFFDKKYEGAASQTLNIIYLLSDSHIKYSFLKSVLTQFLHSASIAADFSMMIDDFIDSGLLNRLEQQDTLSIPKFYQTVGCHNLSVKYNRNEDFRKEINAILTLILDQIYKNDNEAPTVIYQNIMYLLNLLNFANSLEGNWSIRDEISSKSAEYAAKKWSCMQYGDFNEPFQKFLYKIAGIPGYSIDNILYHFIRGDDLKTINNRFIACFLCLFSGGAIQPHEIDTFIKVFKELFNLYVINRLAKDKDLKQIEFLEQALRNILQVPNVEMAFGIEIVEKMRENLDPSKEPEDLIIFPAIKFVKASLEERQKVEKWMKDNPKDDGRKIADLSAARLGNGLRLLRHYLLEEKGVEEIDLSENLLGRSNYSESEAVGDLLTYAKCLKTLRLNNNSLYGYGYWIILEGLAKNRTIETLVLNNNSLEDKHIILLFFALATHNKIRHIELHHNCFTNEGLLQLVILMMHNRNISYISTGYYSEQWKRHMGVKEIIRENDTIMLIFSSGEKLQAFETIENRLKDNPRVSSGKFKNLVTLYKDGNLIVE